MRLLRYLVALLLVPLAACAANGTSYTYESEQRTAYRLDGGDVLRVKVYGDETVGGTYKISDQGQISMPLVGQLFLAGKTTAAAAGVIAAALANGYIRSPNVAVEIETYRPYFIQGAVKTAGQFPFVPSLTVRKAISTAGGYTDTADRAWAVIYRKLGKQMHRRVVRLDTPIQPGDTIDISERWF